MRGFADDGHVECVTWMGLRARGATTRYSSERQTVAAEALNCFVFPATTMASICSQSTIPFVVLLFVFELIDHTSPVFLLRKSRRRQVDQVHADVR